MTPEEYAKEAAAIPKIVRFGYEDMTIVIVLIILSVGYIRGRPSISEFLAYLDVSGTGGRLGIVSGTTSSGQGGSSSQ